MWARTAAGLLGQAAEGAALAVVAFVLAERVQRVAPVLDGRTVKTFVAAGANDRPGAIVVFRRDGGRSSWSGLAAEAVEAAMPRVG